jgi:hypothetical protein
LDEQGAKHLSSSNIPPNFQGFKLDARRVHPLLVPNFNFLSRRLAECAGSIRDSLTAVWLNYLSTRLAAVFPMTIFPTWVGKQGFATQLGDSIQLALPEPLLEPMPADHEYSVPTLHWELQAKGSTVRFDGQTSIPNG